MSANKSWYEYDTPIIYEVQQVHMMYGRRMLTLEGDTMRWKKVKVFPAFKQQLYPFSLALFTQPYNVHLFI